METIQFDNENFVLYAPNSLKHVYKNIEKILEERLELYKRLFDVPKFRKVEIHYFDTKEEFQNCIYRLRGEKKSLPEYAVGTFDNGNIYAYIDPNIKETDEIFVKREHMAAHELFHIMYYELVYLKTKEKRITWFDEGCAQFFSGEKEIEMTENFPEWFKKVKDNTMIIPDLNRLTHGHNFKNESYNGYDLSLLAVKNLYDRLGYKAFKRLLTDSKSIIRYGDRIIDETFMFYSIMYGNTEKLRK